MHPAWAFGLSLLVAGLGWRLRALARDGAVAAFGLGFTILVCTGWPGLAVLGVFFLTSTFVSRVATAADPSSDQAKTEVRDRWQVLANGGFAAAGALAEPLVSGLGIWLVSIVLAAAGSDTWATAFGRLSPRPPRDLISRAAVPVGTSGGVTWFGTIGGLMGAAVTGLAAASTTGNWRLYLAAVAIGVFGMLLDSVLGATAQARFWCPSCEVATEQPIHHCGTRSSWKRGWRWLDNNAVNAVTTGIAGLVGLAAWWL